MTINLRDYLIKNERTYEYVIKSIVPLNDAVMDVIERLIAPYVPQKIGRPTETPFHTNPLDFPNVPGAVKVYSVEITTALPISGFNLGRDICSTIGLPEKFTIVRGKNDPTELETERLDSAQKADEQAEKDGLERDALLNHGDYSEVDAKPGDEYFGDKYNGKLVGYLKKVQGEREKAAVKPAKPFDYLDAKDDVQANDFNDGHEGLKPAKTGNDRPLETGPNGTLEDVRRLAKRLYRKPNE